MYDSPVEMRTKVERSEGKTDWYEVSVYMNSRSAPSEAPETPSLALHAPIRNPFPLVRMMSAAPVEERSHRTVTQTKTERIPRVNKEFQIAEVTVLKTVLQLGLQNEFNILMGQNEDEHPARILVWCTSDRLSPEMVQAFKPLLKTFIEKKLGNIQPCSFRQCLFDIDTEATHKYTAFPNVISKFNWAQQEASKISDLV